MCKHPLYELALSPPRFMFSSPPNASSFTRFHPLTFPPTISYYAIVTLQCFGRHPCSQEAVPISRFTISVSPLALVRSKGVWPGNHSWNSIWHHFTYHFNNWSRFGQQNLTSGDSMCGNRCLILHIGSEKSKERISLCGCQRHWLQNLLFQQNETCYARNMTETCPKITALELQRKFIEFDEM